MSAKRLELPPALIIRFGSQVSVNTVGILESFATELSGYPAEGAFWVLAPDRPAPWTRDDDKV